jgi:hypothetical protein
VLVAFVRVICLWFVGMGPGVAAVETGRWLPLLAILAPRIQNSWKIKTHGSEVEEICLDNGHPLDERKLAC